MKRASSSSKRDNDYVFEQQNDVRLDELGSKISAIKNVIKSRKGESIKETYIFNIQDYNRYPSRCN
jgi:hypothetical protein